MTSHTRRSAATTSPCPGLPDDHRVSDGVQRLGDDGAAVKQHRDATSDSLPHGETAACSDPPTCHDHAIGTVLESRKASSV